jgi:hypothetical protein
MLRMFGLNVNVLFTISDFFMGQSRCSLAERFTCCADAGHMTARKMMLKAIDDMNRFLIEILIYFI